MEGIIIAIDIDDLIVLGKTYEECLTGSIKAKKKFLRQILKHTDKSTFLPTRKITYIGFIFDSVDRLLSITDGKKDKI